MPYQYRNPQYYRNAPEPVSRRRPLRKLTATFIVAAAVGVIIVSHVEAQTAQTAVVEVSTKKQQVQMAVVRQAGTTIRNIIAADTKDTIGVAIENVDTGATTLFGSPLQFEAASTEKVLSAITYYHLVEKGVLSLGAEAGIYPASYQLQQMINQSDNDSWSAINAAVGGNDGLQAYANSIGLQYNIDGNLMSAKDMAVLLTKLYTGVLLNADHTKTLLSYMQDTNDETLIPSVLPNALIIYHKYGELFDGTTNVLHDAAIVTDGSTTYAIVIYSDGKTDEAARTETITRIAQAALTVCGW